MKADETQFGTMLHALQERAKELNCLYQVGELLNQSTRPLEEIFRGIIEVLPPAGNTRTTARRGSSLKIRQSSRRISSHPVGSESQHCRAG